MKKDRVKFLLKNLGKGLLWFAVLVVAYVLFKDKISVDPESILGRVSDSPVLVFSIFLASEIIIGIIPPELFMGWAANPGDPKLYIVYVTLFAFISYGAGIVGYLIGALMSKTILFRYTRRKFFMQVETFFKQYGGFLIFVAAVTPVPFSAVCMLVGSVHYKFNKFLLISSSRFLRFGFYSYILWHAGTISI